MKNRVYFPGKRELEATGDKANTFKDFERSSAFDIEFLAGSAGLEVLGL